MKKKIIVTDGISENAKNMLEDKYIVDLKKGLSPEELKKEIKNYKRFEYNYLNSLPFKKKVFYKMTLFNLNLLYKL